MGLNFVQSWENVSLNVHEFLRFFWKFQKFENFYIISRQSVWISELASGEFEKNFQSPIIPYYSWKILGSYENR